MAVHYTEEFKAQAVKKAYSRTTETSLRSVAEKIGVGYSSLQKWIRQAKDNQLELNASTMSKEQRPQDWTKSQRFEAIVRSHDMTDEEQSKYCREQGIYPHHITQWKVEFLSDSAPKESRQKENINGLTKENRLLKQEVNRKDKALAEAAALLMLSKKCQAHWLEEKES